MVVSVVIFCCDCYCYIFCEIIVTVIGETGIENMMDCRNAIMFDPKEATGTQIFQTRFSYLSRASFRVSRVEDLGWSLEIGITLDDGRNTHGRHPISL